MRTLLLYLPLLACPLMMLICMWAMRGHGRSQAGGPALPADAAPASAADQRIAQLEREVAGLQAQLAQGEHMPGGAHQRVESGSGARQAGGARPSRGGHQPG